MKNHFIAYMSLALLVFSWSFSSDKVIILEDDTKDQTEWVFWSEAVPQVRICSYQPIENREAINTPTTPKTISASHSIAAQATKSQIARLRWNAKTRHRIAV